MNYISVIFKRVLLGRCFLRKTFSFVLYCSLSLFQACSYTHYSKETESALRQSGKNRQELEKVIKHYAHNSDSLHLKAAIFLIENMPGHYGLDNGHLQQYKHDIDSIYPQTPNTIKSVLYTIPQHKTSLREFMDTIPDIENITSKFLIEHIDNAIEMYLRCDWLKDITFDEFCEYLLPYRFANEPLIQENDSSRFWWRKILEYRLYYKNLPCTMNDLRNFQRTIIGNSDNVYMENLQVPSMTERTHTFDCLDHCYYNISLMRVAGIPCVIDYVPEWPTRNGRHYWRVLIEPLCMHRNFYEDSNPRAAKIYRWTYSHNKIPKPRKNSTEYIPSFFLDPFNKDVTEQYINVSDVIIQPQTGEYKPNFLYLAVFNDMQWKPIAWAEIKNGKAIFRNMGRGIVYLPIFFDNRAKLHHAGFPILLGTNGKIEVLEKESNFTSIRLDRKYPLTPDKITWSNNLINARIEASNDSLFKIVDTIYTITRPNPDLNYTDITLSDRKAYRYWRLIKPSKRIFLGELSFWDEKGSLKQGRIIAEKTNKPHYADMAFDNNELTYTNIYSWLGVDFGESSKIQKIRFISRTDANGITPGMIYELVYLDKFSWKSQEIKKAEYDYLEFKDVPSGCLYWLRNLTEGKEERVFISNNGAIQYY